MSFKLDDVAEFQKGFAFKSKDFTEQGKLIVKVSNLTDSTINESTCVKIDEELANKYEKYELIKDDIIITTVGSWPTNPASVVGKVIKVPDLKNGALLNQNAVRVRSKENINQLYLYYLLKNNNFKLYIINTAQGSANQASITQSDIKNFKFKLPTLEQQKAIANVLSTLDVKIEVNNKINQKLEEISQAIFKQWFIDFDFPNEEGKPYKSSGGEMVESELGMIPDGWRVISLSEIGEIKTTSVKPQNNEEVLYEHYSIPAYDSKKYPVFEKGKEIKSNKYKVYNDSMLVSKLNPNTKRVWNPIILTDNAICSTEFINFVPKNSNTKSLLWSVLNSQEFIDYLCQHVTGSTGSRQRANPKSSYEYKIAITKDENKLNDFSKCINAINLRIRNNRIEIAKLTEIRDTLLPKLMSGEIRVPLEK